MIGGRPCDGNPIAGGAVLRGREVHLYVQENVPVPDVEACLPIKEIVISACMKDAWRSPT